MKWNYRCDTKCFMGGVYSVWKISRLFLPSGGLFLWDNFQLKLFVLVCMYTNNSISLTQTPRNFVSCPEYFFSEQGTHTFYLCQNMHLHWVSVGNNVINVGVIVWMIHELMFFVCILALEVWATSQRAQFSYLVTVKEFSGLMIINVDTHINLYILC